MLIPLPRPVEEEKDAAGAACATAVFLIQFVDPRPRQLEQRLVLGQRFQRCVAKIGQQAKVQVRIAIAEKPDFERLDQMLDVAGAGQHGRHHHQSARVWRNACGEVHPGQAMRRHQQDCQPVHQGHGQLTDAEQQDDAERQDNEGHPGAPPGRHPAG